MRQTLTLSHGSPRGGGQASQASIGGRARARRSDGQHEERGGSSEGRRRTKEKRERIESEQERGRAGESKGVCEGGGREEGERGREVVERTEDGERKRRATGGGRRATGGWCLVEGGPEGRSDRAGHRQSTNEAGGQLTRALGQFGGRDDERRTA